jgi:hypothetical protein
MEPLYKEKTKSTPEVILDPLKEIFLIKGNSRPENTLEFFEPILNWLAEYAINPNPTTIFKFEMDYFNSASSKIFLNIIHALENVFKKGTDVKVVWVSTDEDILEAGQAYESLTRVPFEFIEPTQ